MLPVVSNKCPVYSQSVQMRIRHISLMSSDTSVLQSGSARLVLHGANSLPGPPTAQELVGEHQTTSETFLLQPVTGHSLPFPSVVVRLLREGLPSLLHP